jgi:segregation and condensation protein B
MELKFVLESILFSSQKPLSVGELRTCLKEAPTHAETAIPKELHQVRGSVIEQSLEALADDYQTLGRSFRLTCVAGSWQFVNAPAYAPWIKALVGHRPRPPRLTQAALETLAIVAYRQPLTRAEAEQIRGVSVDGVVKMLVDRGLLEQAGRAEVVGRPMTYRTSELFLEYFGLKNLEDLPAADELRRIPVEKPPGMPTADAEPSTASGEEQDPSQQSGLEEGKDLEEAKEADTNWEDDDEDGSSDTVETPEAPDPEDPQTTP